MSTTPIIQLSENVFVAGQIQPGHMSDLAAQGFKHVICNRPDHEVPGQATMTEMAEAAQAAEQPQPATDRHRPPSILAPEPLKTMGNHRNPLESM